MKKVLILKEKHNTRYFDVSNSEMLAKASYKILKERANAGYYYYEPEPLADRIEDFKCANLTAEEIANIPEGIRVGIEATRQKELNQIEYITEEFKKETLFWDTLLKVLELPEDEALTYKHYESLRTSTVWLLLKSRSDHEYEGFEIESVVEL